MKNKWGIQSQLIQAIISLVVVIALSYVIFPLLPISPNYAIAAVIVAAFFLSETIVFILYVLLLLVWLKYAPTLTLELLFIAGTAVVTFLLIKFFLLRKSFMAALALLACFQIIFWALFFEDSFYTSVYFYLEFLYTSALTVLLYGLHTWAQKISH